MLALCAFFRTSLLAELIKEFVTPPACRRPWVVYRPSQGSRPSASENLIHCKPSVQQSRDAASTTDTKLQGKGVRGLPRAALSSTPYADGEAAGELTKRVIALAL